jgi:hypothetical protein
LRWCLNPGAIGGALLRERSGAASFPAHLGELLGSLSLPSPSENCGIISGANPPRYTC